MQKRFKLEINDFGPLKNTDINIGKINIIGGKNATGKSFSSKLLYCFSLALSKQGTKILNKSIRDYFEEYMAKLNREFSLLETKFGKYDVSSTVNELKSLMGKWENDNLSYNYLNTFFNDFKQILSDKNILEDEYFEKELTKIEAVIKFHENKTNSIKQLIHFLLGEIFEQSQLLDFNNIDVKFSFEDKNSNITCKLNNIDDIILNSQNNNFENINISNTIYLNSLTPIDLGNHDFPFEFKNNSQYLKGLNENKNIYDEIYNEKLHYFSKKISELVGGKFIYDNNKREFVFKNNGDSYNLFNVASGYKQIGMLQILLDNGYLSENSILILDEPEVNLHQHLQVKFVELLINLVKELDLTLYVNSHSPIFIEAMEVFTIKYDLVNDTKFYLSQYDSEKRHSSINNIYRREISQIYADLGDPYDIIEDVEVENITNKKFGLEEIK